MSNDFDRWNEKKKKLNDNEISFGFRERDIFNIKMGQNIGHEEKGKGDDFIRPVIVFKKFNRHIFFGIPLTSKRDIFDIKMGQNINKR